MVSDQGFGICKACCEAIYEQTHWHFDEKENPFPAIKYIFRISTCEPKSCTEFSEIALLPRKSIVRAYLFWACCWMMSRDPLERSSAFRTLSDHSHSIGLRDLLESASQDPICPQHLLIIAYCKLAFRVCQDLVHSLTSFCCSPLHHIL